ncbi:MAG: hypothetical protein EAX81_06890 [Candidatus Thorarchaeota archaeon]|nr:hypothetical protein [Candidatus Thorarchaeota archaeon]
MIPCSHYYHPLLLGNHRYYLFSPLISEYEKRILSPDSASIQFLMVQGVYKTAFSFISNQEIGKWSSLSFFIFLHRCLRTHSIHYKVILLRAPFVFEI